MTESRGGCRRLTGGAAASPSAAATDPAPNALTSVLSRATVVYGDAVTVTGALTPAAEDQEVVVTVGDVQAGTDLTDASGAYEVTFTSRRSGDVVARLTAEPTVVTAPLALSVKPEDRRLPRRPGAVPGVQVRGQGHAVRLRRRRRGQGHAQGRDRGQLPRPREGRPRGVPDPAARCRRVHPQRHGAGGVRSDGRTVQAKVAVRAKTLSAGSSGPYVKAMLTGLQRLKFRVPGVGTTFTAAVKDSVVAFQKAYRLSRTYVFNTACWRKLDGAKLIKPKHSSPSTHIEIDKTRQILMIVKSGKPLGIICVSTGATGNTPEGASTSSRSTRTRAPGSAAP